jgi:hypothetical protein
MAVIVEGVEPATPLDVYLNELHLRGERAANHYDLARQVIEIVGKLGDAKLGHGELRLDRFLLSDGKLLLASGEGLARRRDDDARCHDARGERRTIRHENRHHPRLGPFQRRANAENEPRASSRLARSRRSHDARERKLRHPHLRRLERLVFQANRRPPPLGAGEHAGGIS